MRIESDDPLFKSLEACGVDPLSVDIEWDDVCQEDVLSFTGGGSDLTETTITFLAELYLTFPCRFEFPSPDLQGKFENAVQHTPRFQKALAGAEQTRVTLLASRGLSDFAKFVPERETLAVFAARAETACGLEPGQALSIIGGQLLLSGRSGPIANADFIVLLNLIQQAAPEVKLMLEVG